MKLIDLLKQFPYTKTSVEAAKVLFENFYPQTMNSQGPFNPQNELSYSDYGTIVRKDFIDIISSKVKLRDLYRMSNEEMLSGYYNRILAYYQFFQKRLKENPDNTTLDKNELEQLENEAEVILSQQKEARAIGRTKAKVFLETLRQRDEETQQETTDTLEKADFSLKEADYQSGNSVYISPKTPIEIYVLKEQDKESLKNLIISAKTDPQFEKKFSVEIQRNLNLRENKEEGRVFGYTESEVIGKTIAADLANRLKLFDETNIPDQIPVMNLATPLYGLLDSNESTKIFQDQESFSIAQKAIQDIVSVHSAYSQSAIALTTPIMGANLSNAFFAPIKEGDKENYSASTEKKPGSMFEYSRKSVERIKELSIIKSQILYELSKEGITPLSDDEINTKVRQIAHLKDHYQRLLSVRLLSDKFDSPIPGIKFDGNGSSIKSYTDFINQFIKVNIGVQKVEGEVVLKAGFSIGKKSLTFQKAASKIGGSKVSTFLGKAMDLSPTVIKTSAKAAVTKGLTAIAAKTGIKVLISAIGSIAPIIGTILGWIARELLWRLGVWIKRNWKTFLGLLSIPFLLGGVTIGSTLATALGSILAFESLFGAKVVTKGIIHGIGGALKSFTRNILVTVGTGVIIGTIALILGVSFIVFIITSGAYMVPPGGFPGSNPGRTGGGGGGVTTECTSPNGEKPENVSPLYSSDKRFAFPVAPQDQSFYYCTHSGQNAVDVYTKISILPLVAYTAGTIEMVVEDDSLGGRYIILSGNDGRYYYYAHNCQNFVKAGQKVSVGEVIATTDSTGNAAGTPEHLHFAINDSSYFPSGRGIYCPQADFEEKFNLGICDIANSCY